jgi:hypothetical protein
VLAPPSTILVQTFTLSSLFYRYFLITPKLLTNLDYHPSMHVLCVYSSTGLPTLKDLNERCSWHLGSGKQRNLSNNSASDEDVVMDVRGAVENMAIK